MKFAIITTLFFLFSCSLCEDITPQEFSANAAVPLPLNNKCIPSETSKNNLVVPKETLKWTATHLNAFNVCVEVNNSNKGVGLCDPQKDATVATEMIFKKGATTVTSKTLDPFQITEAMTKENGFIVICHQFTPCDVYGLLSGLNIDLAEISLEIDMEITNLFSSLQTDRAEAIARGAGINVVKNDIPAEYTSTMKFFGGFTVHYSSELFNKADVEFSETSGLYTYKKVTASMKEGGSIPSCTEQNLAEKIYMVDFVPSTDQMCRPNNPTCNTGVKISIKEKKESNSATSSFVSSTVVFSAITLLFI